jgi:hypothetical protein
MKFMKKKSGSKKLRIIKFQMMKNLFLIKTRNG